MLSYDWPGNVREMQNWIQFALIKCKGQTIKPEHLPPVNLWARVPVTIHPYKRTKLDMESVQRALATTHGSKIEAARLLEVSRATLYRFLHASGSLE